MSYLGLPTIAVQNSAALIVGTITTVVLAAPGAGLAYRIMVWAAGMPRNAGAGAAVDFQLRDSTGLVMWQMNGCSIAGVPNFHIEFPSPGIRFATNVGVSCSAISTVAGGVATYDLAYYIDTV